MELLNVQAQDSTETLTAGDAFVIKITHFSCQEIITYANILPFPTNQFSVFLSYI